MSHIANKTSNPAYSTRCLPGSAAEEKEVERLAEFQRVKAQRQSDEARDKPEKDAQRAREYEISVEAHKSQMRKKRSDWTVREVKPS